jgi:hypothetical protein
MRIDSSGNVGIGTTSPSQKLHLSASSGDVAALIECPGHPVLRLKTTGTSDNTSVDFADSDSDTKARLIYTHGTDAFKIISNGSERLRIDSSGNVGIGTTAPGTVLHCSATDAVLTLQGTRGTGASAAIGTGGANSQNLLITAGTDLYYRGASQLFQNVAGTTEYGRWDSSGRLLVGTSSTPNLCTMVLSGRSDSSTADPVIRLDLNQATPANNADLGQIFFGTTSDTSNSRGAQIAATRDGGTWSGSSKPTRLVFSTTADGASSPTQRFLISNGGFINCPGFYNRTTATAANMLVDAGGDVYRSTSSAKYKTDIETIQDSYADALLQCRPVWYRSTCPDDNPNWGWWGFIAEEVAAIDPRLVHWKTVEITYDDKGAAIQTPCDPEPEGVQYDRFVPHLLNLIKRQKEQIEAMEARLSALEAQ